MISIYKGIFLPTIVVTIENAHHNEANAKTSNDHYWSKTDIEEDLSEKTGQAKTMSRKLIMSKAVMKTWLDHSHKKQIVWKHRPNRPFYVFMLRTKLY